jgi:hypothetical protein
LARAPKVM